MSSYILSCDCTGCNGIEAKNICGQCKAVYYCNTTCQRNHWVDHKTNCKLMKKFIALNTKQTEDIDKFSINNTKSLGEKCGICKDVIQDTRDVMHLQCIHVVCVSCMTEMTANALGAAINCPLCKSKGKGKNNNQSEPEQVNMYQQLYVNALRFSNKAESFPKTSAARGHYCDLSNNELDKLELEQLQAKVSEYKNKIKNNNNNNMDTATDYNQKHILAFEKAVLNVMLLYAKVLCIGGDYRGCITKCDELLCDYKELIILDPLALIY
mgnify:FL=1